MGFKTDRLAGLGAALLCAAVLSAPLAVRAQQSMPETAPPTASPAPSSAAPAAPTATHHARESRVDAYIDSMHKRLKITAAQQSQWDAVAQVMRDNAATLDKLASDRRAKRGTMSAVDDLQSYEAIADAHADGLKKLVPAFSALYDSMSDAQKTNADAVFGHRHTRSAPAKKS